MPYHGKTKQEVVSEFRISGIMEAARRVFARKGYADTTVDEIADAAGVAKGTVYLYFKSKREIYLGAVRVDLAKLHAETQLQMDLAEGAAGKLRAFIATRVRFCDAHSDFFKIYHSEFSSIFVHPSQGQKAIKTIYQQQVEYLRELLEEMQAAGRIRPFPSEALAYTVYDATRTLFLHRMMGWLAGDVEEQIDLMFELLWNGMAVR